MEEVSHERLEAPQVSAILEAALQAAEAPLSVDQCLKLFRRGELPVSSSETQRELVKRLLEELATQFDGRGVELKRVASGYRLQVRQEYSRWVSRLWEEKAPRYSRALLETLALIAYRQPVTRGDIEQVRGVAVSPNIMRTLAERGWIREVGHREVPGRPALYGTTRAFLDYFNLKTLSELPPLEEIRELIEPVIIEEQAGAAVALDEDDEAAHGAVAEADVGHDDVVVQEAMADAAIEAEDAASDTAAPPADEDAAEDTDAAAKVGGANEPAEPAESPPSAQVVPLPRKR